MVVKNAELSGIQCLLDCAKTPAILPIVVLLYYQCKCQHSEKAKYCLKIIVKTVLTSQPPPPRKGFKDSYWSVDHTLEAQSWTALPDSAFALETISP